MSDQIPMVRQWHVAADDGKPLCGTEPRRARVAACDMDATCILCLEAVADAATSSGDDHRATSYLRLADKQRAARPSESAPLEGEPSRPLDSHRAEYVAPPWRGVLLEHQGTATPTCRTAGCSRPIRQGGASWCYRHDPNPRAVETRRNLDRGYAVKMRERLAKSVTRMA